MNLIQKRFEGFLKTPTLWESDVVYKLVQFEIEQKLISFDIEIDPKQRLGKYVERFVSHQLANDASIETIAENIQISKNKITLGEIDCLLFKNGQPIHLEVIYKFYLFDSSVGKKDLQHWIGPNRKDSLIEKLDKLQQKQLPLLYSKECQEYLRSIDLKSSDISQQVYFKAQLFVPLNTKINHGEVNPGCIVGYYIYRNKLSLFKESKFYIPNKKDWLILPHTNVDWLNYDDFVIESKEYLDREFSPMCWMKSKNGELKKFFLVWWPPEVV